MGATPGADRLGDQQRIARELSEIGFTLPGTLTVRAYRCGKANCRCHADPSALHGPYAYWTRKVGSTTKTRVLTDEQVEDYREWFENARRLKSLLSQLQELAVGVVDDDVRGLRSDRKARAASGPANSRGRGKAAR